jgi:alkylation response protein AidB-like acyl-CoA dehydrogenase
MVRSTVAKDVVERAAALAPQIRAARAEVESGRRLPARLAQALDRAGLFQLFLPRSMGGSETDPLTALRAVEALARADGSVGWCAMLSNGIASFAGWLRADVGRAMFGQPPDFRGAGSFRPLGDAQLVDGGYRVRGRWDFASGINHANWLVFACHVAGDNGPRLSPAGTPEIRMMLTPVETATVLDTWDVVGMRGTGSNDFVLDNVFVPEERTFPLYGPPKEPGPLYNPRMSLVATWAVTAGNSLGMARGAMDSFVELASTSGTTISTKLLRDRPAIQVTVAETEAIINSARAYLLDAVGAAWQGTCDGVEDPVQELAQARVAITHAMRESVRAVDLLFHAAGTNAIHRKHPLERYFRDVHVAVQHGAALLSNFESGGQALLGLRPSGVGWYGEGPIRAY